MLVTYLTWTFLWSPQSMIRVNTLANMSSTYTVLATVNQKVEVWFALQFTAEIRCRDHIFSADLFHISPQMLHFHSSISIDEVRA